MSDDYLAELKQAGIEDAEATFDTLCAFVKKTDYSKARLMRITRSLSFSESEKKTLSALIEIRMGGEPLEYITGEREFYGLDFICRKNVLIPRNDTEILVDTALEFLKDGDRLLDLCSGTGCVGISAAKNRKIHAVLADISEDAVRCSRENVEKMALEDRVTVISHNVFADSPEGMFDAVTANPPYITDAEYGTLGREVLREPSLALLGGPDGLDFYRAISRRYKRFIKDGGRLFFEVGAGQSSRVADILSGNGYSGINIKKDYNGIERVVFAVNIL